MTENKQNELIRKAYKLRRAIDSRSSLEQFPTITECIKIVQKEEQNDALRNIAGELHNMKYGSTL